MGRDADAARLERAVTHGWRPRTKERRTQDAVCRRSLHGRFTECRLLYAATGGRAARLRGSPFTLLNPSTEGCPMEPIGFLGTPEQPVEVVCCSCEHCCAMGREYAVAIRKRMAKSSGSH